MIQLISFYLFAALTLIAGGMTITARNPVHSVLWLILAFFNAAGLMVLAGAEFIAMLLVIVYVGAVAVLFLFVVMMLDIDFAELKGEMARYLPLALLVGVVILMELALGVGAWVQADGAPGLRQAVAPAAAQVENTRALGLLLYDKYLFLFQTAGLILLVAMIGAIVLTLRHKPAVKRQNVSEQLARRKEAIIELHDVRPGQGLREDVR